MKTLRDVKLGETVKVVTLHGEGPVKRRIMDMGITRGTQVFVRKVAPLGDHMEVTVRGYELSLRKADTEMIEVEYSRIGDTRIIWKSRSKLPWQATRTAVRPPCSMH